MGIRESRITTITGVETFRKIQDSGQASVSVGLLLRGTKREDLVRVQVICKPQFYYSAY